ncbi:MAG: DUF2264 domain-containing protein, partial [Phycisphaeraceae bacterium]
MPETTTSYDRQWFTDQFRRLLTGWHRVLRDTAPSGAAWQPPDGVRSNSFLTASGYECDGITRMMPALAAWAALDENPQTLTLDDGETFEPRRILHDVFTQAFDPEHPDYWQPPPGAVQRQAQVESSVVAWSLWLSRAWLMPRLEAHHVRHIQDWLAANTAFDLHIGNWSLFVAVNEAARHALREHGFSGDLDLVRKVVQPHDLLRLPDGWTWDNLGHGIDYYNFWVFGSHDMYVRAMLGDETPDAIERALTCFAQRER